MSSPEEEVTTDTPEILRLPVLPLFETVVFPRMMTPIQVGRQPSLLAVDEAVRQRPHRIVLLTQNDAGKREVGAEDLMEVGVLATLGPMFRLPDGSVQLLAQGEDRVRVLGYTKSEPYLEVEVERIPQVIDPSRELTALVQSVRELFVNYINLRGNLPAEALSNVREVEDPGWLADFIGYVPELESEQRKDLLLTLDVTERLKKVHGILSEQVEVLELKSRISNEVQKNIDKTQREYLLREQMKEIQRELGELDPEQAEAAGVAPENRARQSPREGT